MQTYCIRTITPPKQLFIYDTDKKVKLLSLKEIEKLFNFNWLEWDISDSNVIFPFNSTINLDHYSLSILERLIIRYMKDISQWGLFAKKTHK